MVRRAVRAAVLAGACAVVLAAAGPGGAVSPDAAHARAGSAAGLWSGSTHAARERASKWLSAGLRVRGRFWFRVARDGSAEGYATLAYEPRFDADKLNRFIGYLTTVGGAFAGALPLPGLGAIATANLALMIGVGASFDEVMPVRRGPIEGRLRGGRLSLRWADGEPEGVGFRAYFVRADGREPITSGTMPAAAPFAGTARVGRRAGSWHAVASHRERSSSEGVTDTTVTAWSAHRVGRR